MKNTDTTIKNIDSQLADLVRLSESTAEKIHNLRVYKHKLETPNEGDWFIENDTNTYYQFVNFPVPNVTVELTRKGNITRYGVNSFKKNFRRANDSEVKQHLEFLASREPKKPVEMGKWVIGKWTPVTNTFDNVSVNSIIVKKDGGRLYKVTKIENGILFLDGITKTREISIKDLNENFKLASFEQFRQYKNLKARHNAEKTLASWRPEANQEPQVKPFDITKCDFYMLTIRGEHGSKVRHTSYEIATTEAKRLAKHEQHPVYIMGLVAVAELEVEISTVKKEVINIKSK